MLLITGLDEGGYHRTVTLTSRRQGATLRLYESDGKNGFSGKLLGSIILSDEDAAELKRNL